MSSVKVTKDYLQFPDSSKQSGLFPMIGSIIMWAGDIANIPEGYLVCDGRELDKTETESNSIIEKYSKLFENIGYKYGRDTLNPPNEDIFNIPDMSQRFPYGINESSFKSVVNANTLSGGVKKLVNSHFKHRHVIPTDQLVTGINVGDATSDTTKAKDGIGASYYNVSANSTLKIDMETGDNDDYLSRFNVVNFLIKYKNV